MSEGRGAEELAAQAAEAVRGAIAAAEERAAQIVREAEDEASRIRDRAEGEAKGIRERGESDARAQIDAARKALDELGGTLAAAVSSATPTAESTPDEPEPEPAPEPEEAPGAPEAPVSPPAEPEQQAGAESPAGNGDDAPQRLAAMKLAIDGKDRAEIEAALAEKFGEADRTALLDDVLARAGRS